MSLGEMLGLSFLLIFAGWFNYNTRLSDDFSIKQQAINNITYRYSQTASDLGVLNETLYNELESKLKLYGDFNIKLVAEKFEEDGSITILEGYEIVNYDLRENGFQILNVYVEDKKRHPLSVVFKIPPFNYDIEYRLVGYGSVYIQ